MPIEIGLLSSQQDSFEHHEELSKLLNETDVFYVPLRSEFGENSINNNQDPTDLTKRFDEDLSNKHLIVTFRDIGYSLFLDSVESILDQNDQSKIRISGKMVVDGICIQFFGCFDYSHKTQKHSVSQTQISGMGRVELDEGYYRELSTAQTLLQRHMDDEDNDGKEENIVQPIIKSKTRQQTAKLKERVETNRPKTRSRATSESILPKSRTSLSKSPPPPAPALQNTTQSSNLSASTSRPGIHSPGHMPYPLRSPRTKQHRTLSPLHYSTPPAASKTSEVYPSLISTGPTTFNEYSQMNATTNTSQSIEYSQAHRIQILSNSPHYSSPLTGQTTMPIQIPTSSNTGLPPTSFPQMANLFPFTQSHSLPTYILPTGNFAYITTATSNTNPTGTPFDFTSLNGNTSVLLITNHNQHPSQPLHILTPIDHRSLQFAHYATTSLFPPPIPPPPPPPPSRTCNILQSTSTNESMSYLQNKRHENEEEKQFYQQQLESNKQVTEQLPFKKRRYTGQQTRMATVHDHDDDEVSDESVKK